MIQASIWDPDSDFTERSPLAQHLYLFMVTQRTTSVLGLGDWRPKRMATKAKQWTVDHIDRAGHELVQAQMILVDEETDEFFIRSFPRHDGVLNNPKLAQAILRQYKGCASAKIRSAIVVELQRLRSEFPAWAAWNHPKIGPEMTALLGIEAPTVRPPDSLSVGLSDSLGNSLTDSPSNPVTQQPIKKKPLAKPSVRPESATTATPKATVDRLFAEFWAVYPRREKKAVARQRFEIALRRASAEVIIKGTERYRDDPNRVPEFTAHASSWLNGDRWEDDPLPPRDQQAATRGTASVVKRPQW